MKLTNKQRVLRKYPMAVCKWTDCSLTDSEPQWAWVVAQDKKDLGLGSSPRAAWKDAAKGLK